MGKFQELKVWQRAKELAVFIYKFTEQGAFTKDYVPLDYFQAKYAGFGKSL
jgi:hypothetical protein